MTNATTQPNTTAGETNLQIPTTPHNGSYTLRGTMRTRLLHPHAGPQVGSGCKPLETGVGYMKGSHTHPNTTEV